MNTSHTRKMFYLKPAKGSGINKGKCLIMLMYFCQNRRRYKLSTRIYIPKKFWSDSAQRVISSAPGAVELNISLDKFALTVNQIVSNLKADGIKTSPEVIQERFAELNHERATERQNTLFLPYFDELLGTKESPGRLRRKLKPNTVKMYKLLYRQLADEQKSIGTPLKFEMFTPQFFISFSEKAFTTLGANTVRKRCGQLKTILRMAVRENRTDYQGFEIARIEIKRTEPVTVYLSEEEINCINNLRHAPEMLARNDIDIIIREADRVILGCWLGLRWSDLSRITEANFYERAGKWYLTIEAQKTEDTIVLPVHPNALEILRRYNFNPPKISQQKANELLKRVCMLAGITEPVSTPAGIVPKYKLVTTHTMRRSFATNLIKAGISHYHVMKLGGWKSYASFERYIRMGKQEAAEMVADVFSGNTSALRKVG